LAVNSPKVVHPFSAVVFNSALCGCAIAGRRHSGNRDRFFPNQIDIRQRGHSALRLAWGRPAKGRSSEHSMVPPHSKLPGHGDSRRSCLYILAPANFSDCARLARQARTPRVPLHGRSDVSPAFGWSADRMPAPFSDQRGNSNVPFSSGSDEINPPVGRIPSFDKFRRETRI
jgi:hypothetical protein